VLTAYGLVTHWRNIFNVEKVKDSKGNKNPQIGIICAHSTVTKKALKSLFFSLKNLFKRGGIFFFQAGAFNNNFLA